MPIRFWRLRSDFDRQRNSSSHAMVKGDVIKNGFVLFRRINYGPKNKNQTRQRTNRARLIPIAKRTTRTDGPRSASLPRCLAIRSNIAFILPEHSHQSRKCHRHSSQMAALAPARFFLAMRSASPVASLSSQPSGYWPEEVILTEQYLKRSSPALGRCNRSHRPYYAGHPRTRGHLAIHRLQLICALAQTEKTIRFSPPAPPRK
jgi:hypothetical protein